MMTWVKLDGRKEKKRAVQRYTRQARVLFSFWKENSALKCSKRKKQRRRKNFRSLTGVQVQGGNHHSWRSCTLKILKINKAKKLKTKKNDKENLVERILFDPQTISGYDTYNILSIQTQILLVAILL